MNQESGRGRRWKDEELEEWDKKMQKEQRWERIRKRKFSRWYRKVKGEGLPKYLEKGWGRVGVSRWKRIAKYRLGNEVRKKRY